MVGYVLGKMEDEDADKNITMCHVVLEDPHLGPVLKAPRAIGFPMGRLALAIFQRKKNKRTVLVTQPEQHRRYLSTKSRSSKCGRPPFAATV